MNLELTIQISFSNDSQGQHALDDISAYYVILTTPFPPFPPVFISYYDHFRRQGQPSSC